MKKCDIAAVFVLCIAITAQAGFVDERPVVTVATPMPQKSSAAAPAAGASAPAQGSPAHAAPERTTAALPASWEVSQSDGYLSRALRRWAKANGRLLYWGETTKELQAVPAVYQGDFLSALEDAMVDTERSGYPLHACVYDNAVRILHVTLLCDK